MKNYFYLIVIFLVFTTANSCLYQTLYNTVLIEKDEFKNKTKTYISFREYAKSLKTNDIFFRKTVTTYLSFQSYMIDSIFHPVNLYLSIDVSPESYLNKEFFIKTDSNLFKLSFDNIRNHEYICKDETNTTTTDVITKVKNNNNTGSTEVNNTLFNNKNSKSKEQETTTETKIVNTRNISEYTRKKVRGHAVLDNDISRDILYSNTVIIRYYINDSPFTIKFSFNKLKKLKDFIKAIQIN